MFEDIYKNGTYLEKNPNWHVEESPWKARQILRMLARNAIEPKTICEVGCGAGEVLRQLQLQMSDDCLFWGYEISPQAFAMCQSRSNGHLLFKLVDIKQDNHPDFDLILALDVIEHVEDYFSFLRDLRQESQYKIFHVPLDLSVQTVLRPNALLKRRQLHAHIHYFTKETALQVFQDVGYEVTDYFYTPRSIELGSEPVQKMLRIPRMLLYTLNQDLAVRLLGGFSLLVLTR